MFEEILRKDAAEFAADDSQAIVLPRTAPVGVYRSQQGDVVLRQRQPAGGQDACIVLPPAEAEGLIAAIRRELKD